MNRLLRSLATPAVLAAIMAGCSSESARRADSGAAADSTVGAGSPTDAPGVNVDANRTPPAPDSARAGKPSTSTTNGVTFSGVSPLRIGMSAAEARQALGMPASGTKGGECTYLDTKGRTHAFVMLVRDTVARLDVRDSSLATDAGVRVGDPESRVMERYKGSVKSEPHKYVQGGHYLIVTSPATSTRQIVFETDGKRVTSYRVGRTPEVRWVEGCG